MHKSLAAAALGLFALAPLAHAGILPPGYDDQPSVVDAVARARETGKPVIVYFTESKCQTCESLQGWLLRSDIRQAFAKGYHFSIVSGDEMVPEERERWRTTYSPRGAPAWVVLGADGNYLCTASGGFATSNAALELHRVLSTAVARNVKDSPGDKPRNCSAQALGI